MSCIRTDRLSQTTEVPVFQQCGVHTGPHRAFTNWLNEPSSHSLPVCTKFVLFNSLREENWAETELLFSLYLSVGDKRWFFDEEKKVCQPLVTAMLRHTVPKIKKE